MVLPTVAFADDSAVAKSDLSQSQTEEKRKTLLGDATGAIQDTQAALKHLDDGKTKEALAALERATGWFAKIKASIEDFLKSSRPKNS